VSVHDRGRWGGLVVRDGGAVLGLDTILPLPILYGVWHTKGGSRRRRGRASRNSRAIVLQ